MRNLLLALTLLASMSVMASENGPGMNEGSICSQNGKGLTSLDLASAESSSAEELLNAAAVLE